MWRALVLVFTLLSLNVTLILAAGHGAVASSFQASLQVSAEPVSTDLTYFELATSCASEGSSGGGAVTNIATACWAHAALDLSGWSEQSIRLATRLRLVPAPLILSGITPPLQERPPRSALV